jgi:acyl-coenzyme A thioesterase PaaI-like protein
MMAEEGPLHIAGDWQPTQVTNTGPWTVGTIWLDRASHRYALRIDPHHCNALGTMNGGAMATFLDGQAVAVTALASDGSDHTPSISLHVDFMAPPKPGDWLVAEVTLVKTTKTMIFTQAIVTVGDRAVARSHAIYSNTQGKASQ